MKVSAITICLSFILFFNNLNGLPPSQNNPIPISEEFFLSLNGAQQWVAVHGEDATHPVLLVLHGGPGLAYSSFCRKYQKELEDEFIVVNWDQRGCGKSWVEDFNPSTLTIEKILDDVRELTLYLKKRFSKAKIFLLGHSWGSRLGLLAAQKYPEDYLALFGTSQVTGEPGENEALYDKVLLTAKQKSDSQTVKILVENGKASISQDWFASFLRLKLTQYGFVDRDFDIAVAIANSFSAGKESIKVQSDRYWNSSAIVYNGLKKEILESKSFFEQIPEIKIPVILLEGRYDYIASSELAQKYLEKLKAPYKKIIWFEKSAHWAIFQESQKFNQVIIQEALAVVYD